MTRSVSLSTPGEETPGSLNGKVSDLRAHALVLRRRAQQAMEHANDLQHAVRTRWEHPPEYRHEMSLWSELRRGREELRSHLVELRAEQLRLREEERLQQEWFRAQVRQMIGAGWSREELAESGIDEAALRDLGLEETRPVPPGA